MGYKRWTKSAQTLKPDPRYQSKLVSKFINAIMLDGKKTVATRIVYDAMDMLSKKITDKSPLETFEAAIENVKPSIEVRSKRVGGSNYQVPIPVSQRRKLSLAFRWIIGAARDKSGRPMAQRLANELLDAHERTGTAVTTRENVHRMADANKAFAHFAW